MMGVARVKIQTVEDVYQLLRTAVVHKHLIRGVYGVGDRWLCPHRLGRNHKEQLRALCYQYAGQNDHGLQTAGSQPTGGVSRWRSSAGWSCSKGMADCA
jgi:hypothetical protein